MYHRALCSDYQSSYKPYREQTLLQIKHRKYPQALNMSTTSLNPKAQYIVQIHNSRDTKVCKHCVYIRAQQIKVNPTWWLFVYIRIETSLKSLWKTQILTSMISGFWDYVRVQLWWNCLPSKTFFIVYNFPPTWLRWNLVNTLKPFWINWSISCPMAKVMLFILMSERKLIKSLWSFYV